MDKLSRLLDKMKELQLYNMNENGGDIEAFVRKFNPEPSEIAVLMADSINNYDFIRVEVFGMWTEVDSDGVFFNIPYDTFMRFRQEDWTALIEYMVYQKGQFDLHVRAKEAAESKMKGIMGTTTREIAKFVKAGGLPFKS